MYRSSTTVERSPVKTFRPNAQEEARRLSAELRTARAEEREARNARRLANISALTQEAEAVPAHTRPSEQYEKYIQKLGHALKRTLEREKNLYVIVQGLKAKVAAALHLAASLQAALT